MFEAITRELFTHEQAEKQEMREKLFATLEERRRKLKEEKDNCELTYGKWYGHRIFGQVFANSKHRRSYGVASPYVKTEPKETWARAK